MSDRIDVMRSLLTEADAAQLQRIFAPQIMTVPPTDAGKHLCIMPDGEIRLYGFANRFAPDDEGDRVYIASTDCGLSWKTHNVPDGALGEATQNPATGRWIACYPQEGRYTYPADYPGNGCYAAINSTGPDAPPEKYVKLSDNVFHFQKQAMYLESLGRWFIFAEYRHPNLEKFIQVCYSDDDGDTWHVQELEKHAPHFPITPPHKGSRWQDCSCEPTVAELSDGTLWMLERTAQDYHYQRFSHDGGATWSDPEPSIFHGTLTMPVLQKLRDGRLIFFWCNNQPMPETDKETIWPPLGSGEKDGTWEDVFTNRDANHLAISADDGKTWRGFREMYLNPLRNRADYRSVGGADSRDKSVHQGEMLELPFGKVLISFGQNAAVRKVAVFDPDWLLETGREENFRLGTDNISTHMYIRSNSGSFRGFSGHCAWNRVQGAILCQDPDGNFEEALQICRTEDPRLVYPKQGAVWNFPAAVRGEVRIRLQVMGSGLALSLADHWFNACDDTVPTQAQFTWNIRDNGRNGWHDISIRYDTEEGQAAVFLDGVEAVILPMAHPAPYGICYLHMQSLADGTDYDGTIVKSLSMRAL